MTRADVIRMMSEAGAGPNHPHPKTYDGIIDVFERFADLVAAHTIAHMAPPAILVDSKSLDPELLRVMLSKAQPMSIGAIPPNTNMAAAVAAEREACAQVADSMNTFGHPPDVGAAIRARDPITAYYTDRNNSGQAALAK